MTQKSTDPTENDDIFGPSAKDDGISDIVDQFFDESEEEAKGEKDDGGLDRPLDDDSGEKVELVGAEEGAEILSDAELGTKKPKAEESKKTKEKLDDPADAPKDKDAENAKESDPAKTDDADKGGSDADDPKDNTDKPKEEADDLTQADVPTLLKGLPDAAHKEVSRRLAEVDAAMKPFSTPYIQEQMKAFGASPQEVSSRLVEIATFAAEKPDEYLAWVAKESADPDKIGDLLGKAAERLGYKVTKIEAADNEDDDLFDDPEKAELRNKVAELEGKLKGDQPSFGPDTPERRQARDAASALQTIINETGEDGQPLRPHFALLQPRIAQLAQQHVQTTQKPATAEDIARFYDEAVEEAKGAFGGGEKPASAASDQHSVADKAQKSNAAAEKAMKASKTLDGGSGQSAGRQPAISRDAPLGEVIDSLWEDLSKE